MNIAQGETQQEVSQKLKDGINKDVLSFWQELILIIQELECVYDFKPDTDYFAYWDGTTKTWFMYELVNYHLSNQVMNDRIIMEIFRSSGIPEQYLKGGENESTRSGLRTSEK